MHMHGPQAGGLCVPATLPSPSAMQSLQWLSHCTGTRGRIPGDRHQVPSDFLNVFPILFFNILWMAHLHADAVTMFPQLGMFSRKDGEVRGFTMQFTINQHLSWGSAPCWYQHLGCRVGTSFWGVRGRFSPLPATLLVPHERVASYR